MFRSDLHTVPPIRTLAARAAVRERRVMPRVSSRLSIRCAFGLAVAVGLLTAIAFQQGAIAADPPDCDEYALTPVVPDPLPDPQFPCGEPQHILPPDQGSGAYSWHPDPASPEGKAHISACWNAMTHVYHFGSTVVSGTPIWLSHPTVPDGSEEITHPFGFRSGFNPTGSVSIGDYLPSAPTLGRSSVALLPPNEDHSTTGWQGTTRPVLDGTVDLVTGAPLIQTTDLTLSFGSAAFRLNRTRSQDSLLHAPQYDLSYWGSSDYLIAAQDRWWSWTGLGWMASENPLLIIDSALPDLIGPHPRTTWLVLDAHHAIPFQQVNLSQDAQGNPRVGYEAPPRFRARMRHNGTWGLIDDITARPAPGDPHPQVYGWIEPPTQYEVWLYDGALKYTFAAAREDIPPTAFDRSHLHGGSPDYITTSYHDAALYWPDNVSHSPWNIYQNPGFGIPYIGLCTRIDDRHGHSAIIHYCEATRFVIDDNPDDCTRCMQRCLRKGQISHIELISNGPNGVQVDWLLVYVHRYFEGTRTEIGPVPPIVFDGWYPTHPDYDPAHAYGAVAIDRIYAYDGKTLRLLHRCCKVLTQETRA